MEAIRLLNPLSLEERTQVARLFGRDSGNRWSVVNAMALLNVEHNKQLGIYSSGIEMNFKGVVSFLFKLLQSRDCNNV